MPSRVAPPSAVHPRMHLGVSLPLFGGLGVTELVGLAGQAERAGLDDVAIGEVQGTELCTMIGAMAASTERIRLETTVMPVTGRPPVVIGMAAATAYDLSDGRFVLGLGAGSPQVAAWHGRSAQAPVALMESTVDAVRRLTDGTKLEDHGSYRLPEELVAPVPIVVAAMNDRMLELAATRADGVVLNFSGPDQVARMVQVVRAARARSGLAHDPFEVTVQVMGFAGPDLDDARAVFGPSLAPYFAVPGYRRTLVELSSEAEVDAVAERWRSGGRDAAAALVPRSVADGLLFGGDRTRMTSLIDRYADAGATRVRVLPLLDPATGVDAVAESIAALAQFR